MKTPLRLFAADAAALLTLALAVLYVLVYYEPGLAAYSLKGVAIFAILLSIAAFVLSVRIRAPAVAGMLVVGGLLMQVPPVQAIVESGTVSVPGPILGVIFFSPVFILGAVKAATAWRSRTKADGGARS